MSALSSMAEALARLNILERIAAIEAWAAETAEWNEQLLKRIEDLEAARAPTDLRPITKELNQLADEGERVLQNGENS